MEVSIAVPNWIRVSRIENLFLFNYETEKATGLVTLDKDRLKDDFDNVLESCIISILRASFHQKVIQPKPGQPMPVTPPLDPEEIKKMRESLVNAPTSEMVFDL